MVTVQVLYVRHGLKEPVATPQDGEAR